MSKTKYDDYLKTIGKAIGIELEFDENNSCEIEFNENDVILIEANPDDHNLVFSSMVSLYMPEPISYSLLTDLMDLAIGPFLNRGGNSPVIGRDPESGALIIYQVCTESVLERESDIGDVFLQFIQFKLAFQKHIEKNGEVAEKNVAGAYV